MAVVGVGASIHNHVRAFEALADRVELVAAVDTNAERVQAFCEAHGVPAGYTSVGEMLAAEKPDLVSIVTPPATHKALTIECLEGGAWVLCEKPLAASLADFDALRAAEERTGNYVSTVFQWRFGSAVKHLRGLIANDALGKPLVAVCHTLWYRDQGYYDVPWRGKYATEFGGPTMTLGIHLMDLLLHILGDWQTIQASIGTLDRDIKVEDTSMALVRFANGAMASIVNTALAPRQESYLRLDFQRATAEVRALYHADNTHWTFTPADAYPDVQAAWGALSTNITGAHEQQLREILDSKARGERPPVSGDDARRIIEFTASLYKSAHTGQIVKRGELTPDDPFYYGNDGNGMGSS